jgi:hypothetical protein
VIQSLPVTTTQLSVQDVSAATLSAVAQAVDLVGPLSSEVDVMMTASSLLSHQASIVSPAPSAVSMSGPLPATPVEMSINADPCGMAVFLGFFYSHGVPCCNSDHLDLVYLMMRTQSARASQCISLYITFCCSYRSTTHLSFQFSSFELFPLCLPIHPPLFCLAAFLIEGFMLSPFSLVCFCQRDTCCRIALSFRAC